MKYSDPVRSLHSSIFWGALLVLLGCALPLFLFPAESAVVLASWKNAVDSNLSFVFQWLAVLVLGFSLWLAFSNAGKLRLGDSQPAFSTYSWGSMMFCAGVATGILYWGCIEWAYYAITPPFGLAPHSKDALEWAATYGMFHWGPAGWAFYVVPALAIGHAYYNRGAGSMRLSKACVGALGTYVDKWPGKLIDMLFVVALLGASGTSLGIGTPMIVAAVDELLGVGTDFTVQLIIISLCACLFAGSVYLGLDKGIKRLSNLNTAMAFIFLGILLLIGPTVFILKMFTNSLGLMGQHFLRMITWTDPVGQTGFVEDWSVFYWSWWTAVGPFMGIFIAKISRGRSFKQIVIGTLVLGSAGSMLFYGIFGNYALHQELTGVLISTELVTQAQTAKAVSGVVQTLPWGSLALLFFAFMSLVFMATSFDSTSYVLATSTSNQGTLGMEPPVWLRLFWAFLLVLLPTGLMLVGGLDALKTTVLLSALPMVIIYGFCLISLVKWMRSAETKS